MVVGELVQGNYKKGGTNVKYVLDDSSWQMRYLIDFGHARACQIFTNREVDIINVKERLC